MCKFQLENRYKVSRYFSIIFFFSLIVTAIIMIVSLWITSINNIMKSKSDYLYTLGYQIFIIFSLFLNIILLKIILYKKVYKPIKEILEFLIAKGFSKKEINENDVSFVTSTIEQQISKYECLTRVISQNIPILKEIFLREIITMKSISEENIWYKSSLYNCNIKPGKLYNISVITIDEHKVVTSYHNRQEVNMSEIFLRKIVNKICEEQAEIGIEILKFYNNELVIFFSINLERQDSALDIIISLMREIHKQIIKDGKFNITVGVSSIYRYITNSMDMYEETKSSPNIDFINGNHVKVLKENEIVSQTKIFIDKSFMSPDISLDVLTENIHFSISYLEMLFKKSYNHSIKVYITLKRIGKAKELLNNSDLKIKEIRDLVGYVNDRSFNNIFKKYEGLTPGEFRNQRLKSIP